MNKKSYWEGKAYPKKVKLHSLIHARDLSAICFLSGMNWEHKKLKIITSNTITRLYLLMMLSFTSSSFSTFLADNISFAPASANLYAHASNLSKYNHVKIVCTCIITWKNFLIL